MQIHGGERATSPGARWGTWRAGWERLLADVLGRGASGRAGLYEVLADVDDLDAPWTRQELDALWAAVHAGETAAPFDDRRAVG
jgi:hypothetical protein